MSLTISKVHSNYFELNIIPHTLKLTNLKKLKVNDLVNVELDIFAKYGLIGLFLFLSIFIYILYIFVIHRNDYFSYIGVFTLISQLGFMLTKSQFASQQSTVFFIMLLYICLSSLNKETQEK